MPVRYFRLTGQPLALLAFALAITIAGPASANNPPSPLTNENPPTTGVNVPVTNQLEWFCYDPDGDPLVFDVYFGVAPALAQVATGISAKIFNPGTLAWNTNYNWYVVARDSHGAATQGPLWTFSTRPENFPPSEPSLPVPPDDATVQPIALTLQWSSYDNDGEPLAFDVYFGSSEPLPLIASNITTRSHAVAGLIYDTLYSWRVIARDPHGAESAGPTWSFTTRLANYPPAAPSSPGPWDGSTNIWPSWSLNWSCSDPDGDVLTYDVYFGTTSPPALVATNHPSKSYSPGGMAFTTTYYWRIVVRDDDGVEVSGPQWSFTTRANSLPNMPWGPTPVNNATNQLLQLNLAWSCSDPDGQPLTYDVCFGTTPVPPLVASNVTIGNWLTPTLAMGTIYYWQIVARDPFGAERAGAVWKFTTDYPPTEPSNPSPANGTQLPGRTVTLSWTSTDPESKPMVFEVYFGTSPTPGLFGTTSSLQYNPGLLNYDINYYWYIVASDGRYRVPGPVWTFRTGSGNFPPTTPSNPVPADNAIDISTNVTLSWESTDPNADPLTYRLYFGTTNPPPHVSSNVTVNWYAVSNLSLATDYYWAISARDAYGYEVFGPVWKFRTRSSPPPAVSSFTPASGATAVPPGTTLSWQVTGGEAGTILYEVYFGEQADPPLVASNLATPQFRPASLELGTMYFWKVVPRDAKGSGAPGPLLLFTTASSVTGTDELPLELAFGQAHPNPFNPQTLIPYGIPSGPGVHVRIVIYDAAGRPVRRLVDEHENEGWHEATWRGDNDRGTLVASGVYYCVMQVGTERRTQKLVLLK